jgi:hypothetical protein
LSFSEEQQHTSGNVWQGPAQLLSQMGVEAEPDFANTLRPMAMWQLETPNGPRFPKAHHG